MKIRKISDSVIFICIKKNNNNRFNPLQFLNQNHNALM